MDRRLLEYNPVLELADIDGPGAPPAAPARIAGERGEMAQAAALLSLTGRAQLQRFLQELVRRAGPRLVGTPVGQELVHLLERAAEPVLPLHQHRPVIDAISGPHAPRSLARAARIFGLELEGLSPEDKEFALARQFVRFANAAARAAGTPGAHGSAAAGQALALAARRYAPGLLAGQRPQCGHWQRQGRQLVLFDC